MSCRQTTRTGPAINSSSARSRTAPRGLLRPMVAASHAERLAAVHHEGQSPRAHDLIIAIAANYTQRRVVSPDPSAHDKLARRDAVNIALSIEATLTTNLSELVILRRARSWSSDNTEPELVRCASHRCSVPQA